MKVTRWSWARLVFVATLLTACIAVVGAHAQGANPVAQNFDQVAISPDGNRVAWVQEAVNESGEATGGTTIFVQELKSPTSKPKRISAGTDTQVAGEGTIAWSPDSKHLAFLSDIEGGGQSNFYVVNSRRRWCSQIDQPQGISD